ncbi:hypothetical protein KIW84_043633 [Lathyrus oleraceus]|uniref:Uncharacterized protein n=1 Tax=Pisum sativum TaxID=3888 RepID=A0A9D5APC5_PEA|nr:hypothetical protein KIW84_043633 [Pisum sativum]
MLELARLSKQEEKVIQPHTERIEVVIPSTAEVRKEAKIGVVSEASREQNGSLVERACGCLHLVMSGYARVRYWCRCAQAIMEGRLSSREAERRCHLYESHGCSPTETVCAGSYHFVDFRDGSDRKAIKGVWSDYIVPQPIEDYQPMKFEFPDEDISRKLASRVSNLGAPTGATPFSLVYGMEAVLPVEVQIPSLRVLMDVKLQEAEWVRTRYEELSLVEEKRLAAICQGQIYQQRTKRAFDKKVRPRVYHVGDMVLKRILPPQNDRRGKWTPNYEGPFVVKKVFSGGALLLTTMDGEDFPSPVNADAVKK